MCHFGTSGSTSFAHVIDDYSIECMTPKIARSVALTVMLKPVNQTFHHILLNTGSIARKLIFYKSPAIASMTPLSLNPNKPT